MESLIVVERRIDLYIDILINLTYKIHQTHPGYDCLSEKEDIYNHFTWCFNSVCSEFLNKEIDLRNTRICETLFDFFLNELYNLKKMRKIDVYLNLWRLVFNGVNVESVLYVYKLYDKFDEILKI